MDPIAVTAALLRAQLPDVPLREGASMMARVASRGESHAVIVIAGIPVTAQIPPEVQAGTTLRLTVQEVTPERVTLQIDPQQPAQPAQASATPQTPTPLLTDMRAPATPLQAKVEVEEPPARRRGADGEAADVVSLAFNSPTLGRLDLRLELRGERLLAEVTTPAGRPHAIANGGAERLRAKLEDVGLEATVKIRPRHTPLDLYA
jgi:type IV secretory pathway VirB10-like protein